MNIKQCSCGRLGDVKDSRLCDGYRNRRYICDCGNRWTTVEVVVGERGKAGVRAKLLVFIAALDMKYIINLVGVLALLTPMEGRK